MRYNIKGKNMEVGDRTREKVSAKLDRVKKLFPDDAEAVVLIKNEKLEYVVEVTIPMSKRVVRAEVSADDMMAAVDKAVDIIERQIVRYKKRLKSQIRKNAAFAAEYDSIPVAEEALDEEPLYKIENALKSDLCLLKKQLCRWNFWIAVSLYSETILQSLLMLYIREKTVPSVLLNPNNEKISGEAEPLLLFCPKFI